LLSAVLGGRAKVVLSHPKIEGIFTTEVTLSEVEEYVILLARKRRLSLDTLLLAVATLPVSVVERETYARAVVQARRLIGQRDPDDIEILALALHLKIPLWSNDNDFRDTGVEWYTTAELLQRLGIHGNK
ncbi:MAG TPA: PIN domain-containing protein, partial [Candidatus Limnocylindrales bacterium]|nr:PIN domain-containing protein [Candidatus Limnocylindrales bacterium]